MDFSAPHMGFVISSYAVTIVVLGALALWIFSRARSVTRRLQQLEDEGADRRRKSGQVER
ncbi:heme exporter protein CcmD [Anderseniella sp. Alg231-50]|uniref:heme exporter protein CcmD n=1 Tax=Anderseniella sp. Alg231-50 TaxID=1922226 RepID=UPI00307C2C72